jgi:hypothetical protein
MTATADLREQLILARSRAQRLLDALDDAVRDADALDDAAIEASSRFLTDHRNTGRPA